MGVVRTEAPLRDRRARAHPGPRRRRPRRHAGRPLQRRLLALLVLRRGRWSRWTPRSTRCGRPAARDRRPRCRPTCSGLRRPPARAIDPSAPATASTRRGRRRRRPPASAAANAAAQPPNVAALLGGAWHGPAYPELADVDDGRAEAARLEELRLRAREARAERRLAAGDTDGLVAELAALVDERAAARAAARAADGGPGGDGPARRRRCASTTTSAGSSATSSASSRRRRSPPSTPTLLARRRRSPAWTPAEPAAGRRPTSLRRAATTLVAEVAGAASATHRLVTLVGPGRRRQDPPARSRSATASRGARPDRPVVLCELATADDDVGRRRRRRRARRSTAGPASALAERVADVLGDAERRAAARQLRARPRARSPRWSSALLGGVPERDGRGHQPGAPARRRASSCAPVPPLPVGGDDAPAVRAVRRAGRGGVARRSSPTTDDLAPIAEIVRRLDGLPLAIELAAARLHTLDVAEVAAGLDHRFALLSSGYRTSSRHGSLRRRGVVVVRPARRRSCSATFADLSVFAGSFTAADAAAVVRRRRARRRRRRWPSSPSARSSCGRPDRRYVLLETLRAFGAEQLADDGPAERGRRAARPPPASSGSRTPTARLLEPGEPVLAEIDAALPELRAALGWLLDHGDVERGRPARRRPARLRVPAAASRRAGVGRAGDRRRPRRPQPAGAAGVGGRARTRRGWPATSPRPAARAARRAQPSSERRRRRAAEVAHDLRQPRAVRGPARRGRRAGTGGRSTRPPTTAAQRLHRAGHRAARARLRRRPGRGRRAPTRCSPRSATTRRPHAAYAWYCAGEADLAGRRRPGPGALRPGARAGRAHATPRS